MKKETTGIGGIVFFVMLFFLTISSEGAILWYNGDFDGRNGLANELTTLVSHARTYDDFIVSGGGWNVNSIWTNNLMSFTGVTTASWEIRSGVSPGDGGTLHFSGTSPATQVATGGALGGFTEYEIRVSGLDIDLPDGTYWLSVTPHGFLSGRSFNSTTSGAGAIGLPAGDNDNSFFDSTFFGASFDDTNDWFGEGVWDFSMGVEGTRGLNGEPVIPEPSTLLLIGSGLTGLVGFRRKRKIS